MNSVRSDGSFIYEEGQEKLLATDICEYLDISADRDYDVEINISNCCKPSVTGNLFRTLREEYDIKCRNRKFFANYYTGELRIVFVTDAHDQCSNLFLKISKRIIASC
jgi:hypothetical protein